MRKNQVGSKTKLKRALAILLCFVMCLTLFPTMSLAQGERMESVSTENDLLNLITEVGTTPTIIDVTDDIMLVSLWLLGMPIIIPSGADITIRACGKDITFSKMADASAIFDVKSGGKLTLSSDGENTLTFEGGDIKSTVPSIVVSGELVTNGVNFINHNITKGNGAAISCSGATASCTINGGLFKNNTGKTDGGAIGVKNATLNIDGATFESNKVADPVGRGGAVFCEASAINFKNATFTKNTAMVGGAVEFTTQCTGIIDNCVFKGNRADGIMGKGGALDFDECVNVSIMSGKFEDNYASSWGGAIYTDGTKSDFFMTTVLFENNVAFEDGGAIWNCPLGTAHYYTYSGMMFWNNNAIEAGGDLYLAKAKEGKENGGEYVSDKTYAGTNFDWCLDSADSRFDPENPNHITDKSYHQGSNLEIAMKSNITRDEYLMSKDAAKIVFSGNSSSEGGALANNGFIDIGYKSGLTIEKEVTGENAPADDTFDFTVTFSDGNTYDGVESGSTISLKNNERKLISNIPQGITAVVQEHEKENYTPAQATQEAVIGEYGSELLFVNHYAVPIKGNLTVSKTVTGDKADLTKEFSFTVTLEDTTVDGTFGDMEFELGVATFKLKNGESVTATGLPAGIEYEVKEEAVGGYEMTATGDSGIIPENETATAAFTNECKEYTIKFFDDDSTTLIDEKTYQYGDDVVIPPEPTKADDSNYTYTFVGWDRVVVSKVDGNYEYVAVYEATPKTIHVWTDFTDVYPEKPISGKVVTSDEDITLVIVPSNDQVYLPSQITVTIGDRVLDPSEYEYSPDTGKVKIDKDLITDNVVIKAQGKTEQEIIDEGGTINGEVALVLKKIECSGYYTVNGLPIYNNTHLEFARGTRIVIKVNLLPGYKNSNYSVWANATELKPNANGEFVIDSLDGYALIVVTGVMKDKTNETLKETFSILDWLRQLFQKIADFFKGIGG